MGKTRAWYLVGMCVVLVGVAACRPEPGVVEAPTPVAATPFDAGVEIPERFVSSPSVADNIDSMAAAPAWGWVVATAKGTDVLVVLDAVTGAEVRRVGGPGRELGRFARPNGIAIEGDLVLVVERDNARVQVLRLPDFVPLGSFGESRLARPYGIATLPQEDGVLRAWVSDTFEQTDEEEAVRPDLVQHVVAFDVVFGGDAVEATESGVIGDAEGPGAIWTAESVAVDPARDRMLIADEHDRRRHLKVYTLDGGFTGRIVGEGEFAAQPEGIALWPCGDGGYWVSVDQRPAMTVFVLLDRDSLELVATFHGAVTANTDGIGLTTEAVGPMASGALYAAQDDQAVAAFDLGLVVERLGLDPACRRLPG